MKRKICLLLCLSLCLSCLWGCSIADEEPYVPTGDGLTWDDDFGSTAAISGEEDPAKQELTLIYYPDVTMNPYFCTDFTNKALHSLLYQGLFSVDRDYNVEPVLCSRYYSLVQFRFETGVDGNNNGRLGIMLTQVIQYITKCRQYLFQIFFRPIAVLDLSDGFIQPIIVGAAKHEDKIRLDLSGEATLCPLGISGNRRQAATKIFTDSSAGITVVDDHLHMVPGHK